MEIDFIGELVDADVSDLDVVQRDEQAAEIAATTGGPDSALLVGPATLALDDGTTVTVEVNTPGGNFCGLLGGPQLGFMCIVVGRFEADSITAAWFATESAYPDQYSGLPRVAIVDLRDDQAFVTAGSRYFAIPLASDVRFAECGEVDADNNIVDIDGIGGYEGQLGTRDEIVTVHCYPRE